MNATFYQNGESIDYKNTGSDPISANEVVNLINRIGVAGGDIAPGEVGAVHTFGCFCLVKTTDEAIGSFTPVYYDETNDCITATAAGNIPAGVTIDSAAADEKIAAVDISLSSLAAAAALAPTQTA